MGMKMKFDYSDSKRQIAPRGEYQLRLKAKNIKNSKAGNPMIEADFTPFNPPNGVLMDQIDKCVIRTWISLAENALFTLKNLCFACDQEIECANCHTTYSADLEECPNCKSPIFEVDLDFIDTAQPWAFVEVEKSQDGARDVNTILKYSRAAGFWQDR